MKRPGTDLKIREWKHDFQSYDYTNVFDLYVPTELNLGKNQIKIGLVGNRLEKDSTISIDLIDALGQPIYHEISNIVNDDQTRSIIAHVYDDTSIGSAKLYISANLAPPFQGKKYLYTTDILVDSSKEVESDFVFKEIPVVKYKESTFYSTVSGQGSISRLKYVSGSNSTVSVLSRQVPKQVLASGLTVEKTSPKKTETKTPNLANNEVRGETAILPEHFDNSVLTSTNFTFSSSMEGGTIYLNNVAFPPPPNWSNMGNLVGLSFSSSIVKVINTSSIEIYPPIGINSTYLDADQVVQNYNADRLFNHANFTCSFYDKLPTTAIPVTKSFAVFEIGNLETEYGKVESVKITYKPVNEVGEFRDAGTFKVNSPTNFLIDASSSNQVEFGKSGLAEKSMGRFVSTSDFASHWQPFNGIVSSSLSNKITKGIKVWDGAETGEYVGFRMANPEAAPTIFANTELGLKFGWNLESPALAQMDVFVSGIPIQTYPENSAYKPSLYEPSASSAIGNSVTYLGSLTNQNKDSDANFRFKTLGDGNLNVIFLFKRGTWHLGDIAISPINDLGQGPSQTRIVAPLDNLFVTGSELILKLDYIGSNGQASNYVTDLYGVKFNGTYIPPKIDYIPPKIDYDPIITRKEITKTGTIQFDNRGEVGSVKFDVAPSSSGYGFDASSSLGYSYNIIYNIIGTTGSFDRYVWGGTMQGRAIMQSINAPAETILYSPTNISGSISTSNLGGFGKPSPAQTNLDSWLIVSSPTIGLDGGLNVEFQLTSTSSFFWQGLIVATMDLYRYEYKT